mmetsp:Transcript_30974/g.52034  ORF Transcript_30974/g.52034 Transcript_30974/m.52034 type:complete len:107 (-) Transcript_30974:241-561(-)|eukprot:CAMPEP_0198210160 /NCGR_PEP_ID=MMETSP1445-20131203/19768_1 /TAXON_ID=36898 /ORGANISM="Pyramimonas sp., Strain CCMP2087" /LENGTH=106 /DNA_ID=CAMNT_0043884147 /DNA_START=130 /DNA_END=450 /DNA_ORIENTATION=+
MAAHLARAAARALNLSPAIPGLSVRPNLLRQTRGMAGGGHHGVKFEGMELHDAEPVHKWGANIMGGIMWFWLMVRVKEDGATFLTGHAAHFEHEIAHENEHGHGEH